jgi:hypothetical protein
MISALAQKRSHVLPQDVSTVLDFLAQDIQELHALEKKSSTRELSVNSSFKKIHPQHFFDMMMSVSCNDEYLHLNYFSS